MSNDNNYESEAPSQSTEISTKILRARAKVLAVENTKSGTEEIELLELVEFLLDRNSYAFLLEDLREVCPLLGVTPIPCAPTYFVGVINLRGQIIPIVDLHSFLEIPGNRIPVFNKAVIIEKNRSTIGFLVDEVVGFRKLASSELQSSLSGIDGIRAKYTKGITLDRLVVLDSSILSDPLLISQSEFDKRQG